MNYADTHMHALFAVDDGPSTEKEMFQMVDAAYDDGARLICLTPHFHPGYFGDNRAKAESAFQTLLDYENTMHPDLKLYLANELRYSRSCISWLDDGMCRTLGKTNRVLVDFSEDEDIRIIIGGVERLLSAGYVPVLAHVERYTELRGKKIILQELRDNGVLLQMDSKSVFNGFGLITKVWSRTILDARLIDIVASDAHDISRRTPGIGQCYRYIAKKCGTDYANAVCRDFPQKIILGKDEREEEGSIYG